MSEQRTTADALYLDAEHFALTTEQQTLEPRERVLPVGRPFPGLLSHECDERCVCPVHGTPLIYWPDGKDHACQDVNCRYGHGMRGAGPVRPDEEPAVVSPGRYEVPPGVEERFPPGFLDRINQGRRPNEEPTT